jgi:peroxiredoxin
LLDRRAVTTNYRNWLGQGNADEPASIIDCNEARHVSSHSDIQTNTETRIRSSTAERLRTAFQNSIELDGTLAERLSAYGSRAARFFRPTETLSTNSSQELRRMGPRGARPAPGQSMPPFVLPDESGRLVDLEALLANGPTAIMFHRGHWCPYCRMSVDALVRSQEELKSAGGQVVVITPERQEYAKRFKSDWGVPFPILTDLDNGYALALGLAVWLTPDIQQLLADRDLPAFMVMTVGCCQSQPLSSSERTGSSKPASSIPISVAVWTSRAWYPPFVLRVSVNGATNPRL